jgi:signal recognition particle subunit SRP54
MVRQVQSSLMNSPNGLARKKVGTGKRLTPQEKDKLKKQREKELRRRKREQRRGLTG